MICYEMMEDLYKSGIVPDAEMRKFEKNCFIDDAGHEEAQTAGIRKIITPVYAVPPK